MLINTKSWRQHPTRHQLYGHLPPITKTIQVRRTRNAGHCWRSKDELISDVLLWTPTYGRAKAGRPARTYIQQLCEDNRCNHEDLPEEMNDREKWRERVRDIHAGGTTWWWWWWFVWRIGTCGYTSLLTKRLEKQGRTHKWCTLMDPHTWPCKSRTTSTNIHSATMWGYGMLSRRPARGGER